MLRDFGDDILTVMRDCPRICRYLHVPAQSGSNAVLKRMTRGYSREQYLEFINDLAIEVTHGATTVLLYSSSCTSGDNIDATFADSACPLT